MIIHLSVLLVIILVSCAYSPKETYLKSRNTSYIMSITPWLIVFGYLAFLSAARSGMNDTPVYISSFENLEAGWNAAVNTLTGVGKDKGFDALASIFKEYVSDNYHLWFLFFSAIESICFIRVYRKESYSLAVSCYFFFAGALYYNYFSMMRQWFAVALVFSGFKWLKEKRVIPYILLCVLAAQFHASAYLCIIFYFLVQGKPWNRKQNCIWVLAAAGVIFLNPLLGVMENALQGTTYDYAIATMKTNTGSSPVRILLSFVPVALAFVYRKYIEYQDSRSLDICVNMAVLNFVLNTVATFTSGLYVIRLATYLASYNAILYSFLLEKCFSGSNKKLIKLLFYMLYLLFYWYQMSYLGAWEYNSDIIGSFS